MSFRQTAALDPNRLAHDSRATRDEETVRERFWPKFRRFAASLPFAEDLLTQGVSGMSIADMRSYLEFVADRRLAHLGMTQLYGSANPFAFMELQDVQELSNFFERRVSAYQVAVGGQFSLEEDF